MSRAWHVALRPLVCLVLLTTGVWSILGRPVSGGASYTATRVAGHETSAGAAFELTRERAAVKAGGGCPCVGSQDLIFEDGFESGGLGAWSGSSP